MAQLIATGPGLAKCAALSADQQSNLGAKLRFEALLRASSLAKKSKRWLAKFFGVAESTYRGWLHRDALDRRPPDSAFEKLERYVAFDNSLAEFGALA